MDLLAESLSSRYHDHRTCVLQLKRGGQEGPRLDFKVVCTSRKKTLLKGEALGWNSDATSRTAHEDERQARDKLPLFNDFAFVAPHFKVTREYNVYLAR